MGIKNYFEGDAKSNLFIFKDLANPRLTWRLYNQKDSKLLFTGFYSQDASFGIFHDYSNGLGNDLETAFRSQARDMLRGLARASRDAYNAREYINTAKNFLGRMANKLDLKDGSGFSKARNALSNFDLDKEWELMLRTSKVVTQGDKSKLFDNTHIEIPTISNLQCVIWSVPNESCRESIKKIYETYFVGKFVKLENEGGGYWEGPNNINLGGDDPLSNTDLPGSFSLRVGPYLFKNLILKSFKWDYSKELIAYPSANGDIPTYGTEPAYAKCSIDLENYKYMTKEYLDGTYVPEENKLDKSLSLVEYNRNS